MNTKRGQSTEQGSNNPGNTATLAFVMSKCDDINTREVKRDTTKWKLASANFNEMSDSIVEKSSRLDTLQNSQKTQAAPN